MDDMFKSELNDDFSMFVKYREALGYSIRKDCSYLKKLDRYICAEHPDSAVLSQDIVLGWLAETSIEAKHSLLNRATFIRNLGRYFNAIGKEAYIIPQKYVSVHKNFTPYLLSDDELSKLFHEIDRDSSVKPFVGYLLSTLFRLIYTCGMRPSEGRTLERDQVDLDTGEIRLTGTKNREDRLVVMSDDMLKLMRSYLKIRDTAYPDNTYLFPAPNGECYSSSWVSRRFHHYFAQIHPDADPDELPAIRVHDLRHRFATQRLLRWIDEGHDLNAKLPYLRTYLGHSTMDETLYYIHILPENLISSPSVNFDTMRSIIPEVQYNEVR